MKRAKRIIAQMMTVILLTGIIFPHVGVGDLISRAEPERSHMRESGLDASGSNASSSDTVFPDDEELLDDRLASDSNMAEEEFYFEDVIDGITIIMSAEKGVLPKGTTVEIVAVSAEEKDNIDQLIEAQVSSDKQIEDIFSFDITLFYEGKEIEPVEGNVNVRFLMPEKKNVRTYETEIYHISDEMETIEQVDTTVEDDGTIQIQAEHFSVYTITTFLNTSKDPFPGTDLSDDWSGERIFFGRAPQAELSDEERKMLIYAPDEAFNDKKEIFLNGVKYKGSSKYTPIEWRILDDMDDEYLLLSEYVLDAHNWEHLSSGIPTWESSEVRRWLNEDYINQIFTEEEQEAIALTLLDNSKLSGSRLDGDVDTEDKLFLPSYADLMNREYGFPGTGDTPSRQTDYTKGVREKITVAGGSSIPDLYHKKSYYWTRSRGIYDYVGVKPFYASNSGLVKAGGTVYHTWVLGIRPELVLESASDLWSEDEEDDKLLHGMRFPENSITMQPGEEKQLQLEYLNWTNGRDDIHWYKNSDCITLSPDGTVKALEKGEAGITAYSGNIAAYCNVIVLGDEKTITYELNGGSNHADNPSVYSEGSTIELKDPAKENNRFLGWYTSADFNDNSYIDKIDSYMEGDLTLYARWLPQKEEEVTKIQYLVLSEIVYHDLEFYTYDRTRKTINQMSEELGALGESKTFSNRTLQDEQYADLYRECLKGWIIEEVFTGDTGFYAAVFENLVSGKKVFVFRGSDSIDNPENWINNDWSEDITHILLNDTTQQFADAIQYVGDYIGENGGTDNLSIAGHSLGGGLGILTSNVFGVPAYTFNASSTLDVSYYRMWDIMSRNFDGIDRWKYKDHINEHDIVVGLWEKEMKCSTEYKDLYVGLHPFGPHGLESMIFNQGLQNEKYSLPIGIRERHFGAGDTLEKEVNKAILVPKLTPIHFPEIWNRSTTFFLPTIISQGGLKLGSSAKDEFNGSNILIPHTEVIYGGAGNDVLNGFNGDDYLIGGPGDDVLDGNSGNDTYIYWKGHGADTIYDIQGKDKLKLYGFEKGDEIMVDSTSDSSFVLLTFEGETIIKINKNRKLEKNQTFLVTVIKDDREQKLLYIEDWFKDWSELQKFTIKCPVQVEIYDEKNELRLMVDSDKEEVRYTEFGNIYVVYDETEQDNVVVMDLFNKDYTMVIKGTDAGTMDVAVQTEGSENTKTYTSENLPLSKQHQYMLERDKNLVPHLFLKHDEQGIKNKELEMLDENGVSTLPKDETENESQGTGGGGGGGSSSRKHAEVLPDSYPGAYWLQLETGQWKLMKADHTEITGWARMKGCWYYLNPADGIMQTGWISDAEHRWYYLTESGAMLTGWFYWTGNWYYLDDSGMMRTGWIKVKNQWYYLQANGAMLADAITPDGYQVGVSGAWIQ